MFMTLYCYMWLVKHDKWHPEQAIDDMYGAGLMAVGIIESAFWFLVLYIIAKGFGVI